MMLFDLRRTTIVLILIATTLPAAAGSQQAGRAADRPQAPDGMVLIPAGPFPMGNSNDFYDNDFDEQPRHIVNLPPFFMDIFPVTNRDYKAFTDATGHAYPHYWSDAGEIPEGKELHPVTGVNFMDATAFAAWKGRRLPTEQEWEKAARGDQGLRWPWGNAFDESKANVGQRSTTPIGAYPEGCNAYGLCDMAGNVWEWTTTWYAPYPGAPANRAILRFVGDKYLSVRGGSYGSDIGSARGADRGIKKPREFGPSLGFRTVKDVPGYEGYREALQTIELARETIRIAAMDVTEYAEHAPARKSLADAATRLSEAEQAFVEKRFAESGILAQHSISEASRARQSALDVRSAYQAKQRAGTADVLGRLETALNKLSKISDPDRKNLVDRAQSHLDQGRQLEAEGGWGYAQMHGYIGLSILAPASR